MSKWVIGRKKNSDKWKPLLQSFKSNSRLMRNNNTIPLNLPFSHFLSAISNSRYIRGILRFLTELKIAGLNCNLGLFLRGPIQFLESKRFLLYLVYIFCAILRLPQMLSTDLIMTLRFHCLRLTAFLKLLQDVSCMVWLFNVTRMWLISFPYFTSSRRQKNTTSPNHVRFKFKSNSGSILHG